MSNYSSHLDCVFDQRERDRVVETMKKYLLKKDHLYNGFIITGLSGAGIGFILAKELNKKIVVVRKKEFCHTSHTVENISNGDRLVWIDDFVDTGSTGRRIYDKLEMDSGMYGIKTKIVGALLYEELNSPIWGQAALKRRIGIKN